jgi:hypothetical protein
MQAVMIALGQRHTTDDTQSLVDGAGLGIGAIFGSVCAANGADPGPLTERFATALAHGLLAGATNARPAGQA